MRQPDGTTYRLGGFCSKPRSCQCIIQVWTGQLQVFFWFSGHGAAGAGGSQLLIGEDGRAVNFLDEFDTHVTRALQRDERRPGRGASVVAVLDCCRDALPPPAMVLAEGNDMASEILQAQFGRATPCRPARWPFALLRAAARAARFHTDSVAPASCSGQAEEPSSADVREPVSYAMPVRPASCKVVLHSKVRQWFACSICRHHQALLAIGCLSLPPHKQVSFLAVSTCSTPLSCAA